MTAPLPTETDLDIVGNLDYLIETYPHIGRGLERAKKEIERVRAENLKLATALRYYAEPSTYEERYDHVPYGATTAAMPVGAEIHDDEGAMARAALGIPEPTHD